LQGYDLHQRSYSESQMVPRLQCPGQRQYSLRAHRVPPGPLGNNAVNQAISSSSTPQPGHRSGAPGRPPGDLTWKRFLSPAEPRNTDGTRIASLPPSREVSYVRYDAHDESEDLLDLRGTEGKPRSLPEENYILLEAICQRMAQATYSVFNNWKKVWVAGFRKKKHQTIIRRRNHLKQARGGPPALGDSGCRVFRTI
jgi:hypothetical protein